MCGGTKRRAFSHYQSEEKKTHNKISYSTHKLYIYVYCIGIWGQSWRRGTKCACKRDWLWVLHSRKCFFYLHLYFHFFALVSTQSAALSSFTQHAMPLEFGRKLEMVCLNTRFSLPTLAGGIQPEADLIFMYRYGCCKLLSASIII